MSEALCLRPWRRDDVLMPELPRGTVTLLFTDIEGSTRLLHELGDGYARVLTDHRRLLREAFVRAGGVVVDTQGDSFFVAFADPRDSLAAAADAQIALARHAWPGGAAVRVRMGLHTGPEHDRVDLQPQLVDEVVLYQRAQELEAAGDDDFPV
jgi:class 3 adenylate cyclase